MTVQVEYVAQMRAASGTDRETVDLKDGGTAEDLILQVAAAHGGRLAELLLDADRRLRPSALVFVGDEQLVWGEGPVLADGARVTVLAPLAGG